MPDVGAIVAGYVEDREARIAVLEQAYARLYETAMHQAAVCLRNKRSLGPERIACARYLEQCARDKRLRFRLVDRRP